MVLYFFSIETVQKRSSLRVVVFLLSSLKRRGRKCMMGVDSPGFCVLLLLEVVKNLQNVENLPFRHLCDWVFVTGLL